MSVRYKQKGWESQVFGLKVMMVMVDDELKLVTCVLMLIVLYRCILYILYVLSNDII